MSKESRFFTLSGREVDVVETDFQFGEGCYVTAATFVDDGTDLDIEQCDQLSDDYQAKLYADGMENMYAHAYDLAKDARKYGDQ